MRSPDRRSVAVVNAAVTALVVRQLCGSIGTAALIEVAAHPNDYEIREDLSFNVGSDLGRVGSSHLIPSGGRNVVFIFGLPVIGPDEYVASANFRFFLAGQSTELPPFNADLFGIGFFTSPEPVARYSESNIPEVGAVKLHDNIITQATQSGVRNTAGEGDTTLGLYLQSFYRANPTYGGGSFVFLRLSPDSSSVGDYGYNIEFEQAPNPNRPDPLLAITTVPEPSTALLLLGGAGFVLKRRSGRI